ncbi:hypothetical protein SAMN05443665_10088 [Actinomadura meyerae]|uniref:MYXO-CTERM domain-containing protein n=1 Tax=Actinomadura meyerae TaxID=240840 RepID=A0A239GLA3_9ACTN|nr:hypothetical protein [Actinomadura meyerae]SNS69761.1 hypothetical protein SAMN05443665_10088 [Actinomadura meyerae]
MSSEPSPGERLAAALRRSPIYVDPSLASALPQADRARLVAKFRKLPVPVFVVLVPLVKGGTWNDDDQLATVVHAKLGRDGVYITFSDIGDDLRAKEFGGDHQARYAAWAVAFDRAYDDAPISTRLDRIADLMLSGNAKKEYDRQSAEIEKRAKKRRSEEGGTAGDDGAVLPITLGAAGVAAAGVGGLLLWRRRRMASVHREGSALLLPRTVFSTAKRASEDQLREQASHEVIAFGELLDTTDVPVSGERTGELMTRALDAYQAAGKVLDRSRGIPDLAGVLVLVDQGRDALASARALASGEPEIPPSPLCFFNPLHGDAGPRIDWRPIGSRRRLRVHACRDCARAARAKNTPDILMDRRDGRDVPYFEVDPTQSLWAETGYGHLREDLIERIQRGEG